jgi:hypothetical protein
MSWAVREVVLFLKPYSLTLLASQEDNDGKEEKDGETKRCRVERLVGQER